MRANGGAGGLAPAGGSGSSINSDWITVEPEAAGVAAAGVKNPDEGVVPNTVDYNGEVGCQRIGLVGGGRCKSFGARCVSW